MCGLTLKCGVARLHAKYNNFCQMKAGIDLLIVARPTLNSREVLTRITQKETRRVMVFEREREREI